MRHDFFHRRAGFAGDQFHLGLRGELRIGHFYREHAGQAFAHVIAGDINLGFFGDFVFFDVFVDHPGHCRAQTCEMGAAIGLGNVVGEAQHLFLVAVIPLHGHFHRHLDVLHLTGGNQGSAFRIKDIGMKHGLAAINVFDKSFDPAGKGEVFLLAGALIEQLDLDPVVEKGKLAQTLGQDVVVKFDGAEDFLIGKEMHLGTVILRVAENLERTDFDPADGVDQAIDGMTAVEFKEMLFAIAADGQAQKLGQGVDARNSHAMQTAGHLVRILVELATGMQHAHDDFGGGAFRLMLVIHLDPDRNAATVVGDGDGIIRVNGHGYVIAITGEGFVNRVVHHLEDHVVQTRAVGGIADVHAGALAYGFQAFELLNGRFVVAAVGRVNFAHGFIGSRRDESGSR